ncbi:chitin synthase-domain-containing protein [Mycotypha africana]|uniref:chitin synthase-domain-containing protein n=1 Tax=Mycotypha africana TaxID=64632 RepID=UPI002300BA9C|nr:chitin synthase-domain-containing protein [Mycotypha africana]KAI8991487.1 chitin synthase-domain-containing protein [Mycotypha africana]
MLKTKKSQWNNGATVNHNITDIALIPNATNDNLASFLKIRYDELKIYVNLGSHHLITVNPFKELAINDHQTSLEYAASYKEASKATAAVGAKNQSTPDSLMDPHLFDFVNRVYFHMRRTGFDETVFISIDTISVDQLYYRHISTTVRGESGSGKSNIRRLAIRHLVQLSSHRKESKLQTQIKESQRILQAFGECLKFLSNNEICAASRYGYYGEIQFNERGRMIGSKILCYFLEKSCVTVSASSKAAENSNFNIFYYLLAGISAEEKAILQLPATNPDYYNLLANHSKRRAEQTSKDAEEFKDLKLALKVCGFQREQIGRIFQLIASILHLGNLQFVDPVGTGTQEASYVKNTELLELVADFLGLDPQALENVLTFRTTMIRKDFTTLILNAEQAALQRDSLCQTLYSLLFLWLIERINSKTCTEEFTSFVSLLDFPGLQQQKSSSAACFEQLCINYGNERVQHYLDTALFRNELEIFQQELVPTPEYTIDGNCIDLFNRRKGLCNLINSMADTSKRTYTDDNIMDSLIKFNSSHPSFDIKVADTNARHFIINHFGGSKPVAYSTTGFINENSNQISVDFLSLFKGGLDVQPSWNAFIVELFANVSIESQPKITSAIIGGRQSTKPQRAPSQRRSTRHVRKNDEKDTVTVINTCSNTTTTTVLQQLQASMDELIVSLNEVKLWTVSCITPKSIIDPFKPSIKNSFDVKYVSEQLEQFKIVPIIQLPSTRYLECYSHQEFIERYSFLFQELDTARLVRSQCETIALSKNWSSDQMDITQNKVFLSASAWQELENQLRHFEKAEQQQRNDVLNANCIKESVLVQESAGIEASAAAAVAVAVGSPLPSQRFMLNDQASYISETEDSRQYIDNEGSCYGGSESYVHSLNSNDKKANQFGLTPYNQPVIENLEETEEDQAKMTPARKRWLFFVYFATWWIPSKFLICCGRMKRKDIRVAWREKVTLCMLIFLLCAFILWFLIFFGDLVCPKQHVFSPAELQNHDKNDKNSYVSIRGEVFDLTNFVSHHYPANLVPQSSLMEYAGKDATDLFPVQVSALCQGADGTPISPYVSFDYNLNLSDSNAQYHDFRYSSENYNPNWYYDQMTMLRQNYKVGHMGYEYKAISDQAKTPTIINGINTLRTWAVIDNRIYDLTSYMMGGRYARGPPSEEVPSGIDTNFMSQPVVDLFQQKAGSDITNEFNKLPLDAATKQRQLVCLRNLFFVGFVDSRNSTKCQFSTYLLLIVTILLCAVIAFKFIAAIRLGGKRAPEEHDKFVICQITCYTEDEESLRKTIDSISKLDYDDKRKLLFVICDGMIVGSGNDLPTPRIALNILGVDPQVDPEPLSFVSVGEGSKQHNMGKIYSGLYEVAGHVVPYIVVVKCGNPRERQKPGNRGKRDSQLILMQFLNHVHYDAPMNPLQLEIYHQMKNIIGVNPSFYEFVLMVDADTEVEREGLNHLVSSAVQDSKIIGVCGETTLSNEKDTWITMIQVYEYFISHHMIKSFESLFSTVSCLPGCFTMYRVRTADSKRALFVSNEIIDDYSINVVDTLHKKNLLHLGEDRYLTTLLLKHFPSFKTKFNPDAHCKTNAPDIWSVLISQRRRWINSTIHNLGELVFLPRLCGFCCFSMRFVVMLDLISTLVMPAILGYLGYLIYTLATSDGIIPIITIATVAGTYGLQALLFIIMGRWEFIIWMLVSILAIPIFSFYIPIYAYWHFDDFSWGNTRIVVGEKGKKLAVAADEGNFDPKSIPTMKWSQYEQAILSEEHWSDNLSQGSSSAYTQTSRPSNYSSSNNVNRMIITPAGSATYNQGGILGNTENMTAYTSSMMQYIPQQQRMSSVFDQQSISMPSSTSLPMMVAYSNSTSILPLTSKASSRSITSFAPPQSYQNLHGGQQYIPLQHSSQFGNSRTNSFITDSNAPNAPTTIEDNPKNGEIFEEVQRILTTADLTKITKKQVREELQATFGVPMNARKDYINFCIEAILQNNSST